MNRPPARVLPALSLLLATAVLLVPHPGAAQEDGGFLSAPVPVPAAPAPLTEQDLIEQADVTIIETETETIYEYRVNGRVWMARVQPIAGPPYFMMDVDGDGTLDVQNQRPPELVVPQWLLFSW